MIKRKNFKPSGISRRMDAFQIVLFVIVTLYVVSMIFVMAFGLLNSVKSWVDFQRGNIFGLPRKEYGWHFDNYKTTFEMFYVTVKELGEAPREVYLMEMFLNSFAYSLVMTLFCMATEIVMAYAVSKYEFRFRKFIYGVAVVVMLIPIIGSLASEVQFADFFGLKDSLIGVCIMKCKFPGLYFLVFYATFRSISWTYAEAAQIDGASHLRIFVSVMLPLIKSTMFAVFILLFIENWNDYYTPMIFLPNKPTIAYGLFEYQNNVETNMSTPIKLSACFLACLPILAVFVVFKNKIMGNVTMGGIKG